MIPKSMIGKWLKKHIRETRNHRDKLFVDVVLFGEGSFVPVDWGGERMKWFESPNAEGYLDM